MPPLNHAFRSSRAPARALSTERGVGSCSGIAAIRFSSSVHHKPIDSLAQSCGLSLPTFNHRGWLMPSSIHYAPLPAVIAATERTARRRKQIDSTAGDCSLCPPSFFERIGTMAVRARWSDRLIGTTSMTAILRLRMVQTLSRVQRMIVLASWQPLSVYLRPPAAPPRARSDDQTLPKTLDAERFGRRAEMVSEHLTRRCLMFPQAS